ncbi:MAG: chromosome segregation protein SMC, partial [Syntrophomonadaceae bacterium]|nr:chromosome segregation protein SMC [Syntrophomonadaceae bacterium]
TDSKRPLGMAQVEITIDNQARLLPLDFAEVTVGRKVFRSGESEFTINHAPVRLKDIQQLFAGTGLGRMGFSIIGQGELEQVLNARSLERRLILEEASGIILVRHKLEEAGHRLRAAEQDLQRLEDLLEARRAELQVKAERVRVFRATQEQLLRLERFLLASDILQLERERDLRRQELEVLAGRVEGLQEELAVREAQSQERSQACAGLRAEAAECREQRHHLQEEMARLEGDVNLARERIRGAQERLAAIAEDERKYAGMLERLAEDLRVGQENLQRDEEACARRRAELQGLQQRLGEMEARVRQQALAEEELRTQLVELVQGQAAWRNEQAERQVRLRRLQEREERCARESAERARQAEVLRARNSELEAEMASQQAARERLQRERAELEALRQHLQASRLVQEEVLAGAQAELAGSEQRLAAYRELEQQRAGYGEAVRALLRAMEREPGRWPGLVGLVGDLVEVGTGLEVAIQTALGRGIENVVVRSEAEARRAIALLQEKRLGRVTFLPLDLLRPGLLDPAQAERLAREPGVVGWAWQLVQYPPECAAALQYLLGRVLVVEDLEAGVRLYRRRALPVRLVTLAGEVLSPGGAITGGRSGGRTVEPLRRRGLIRQEEARCRKAQECIAEASRELESLGQQLQEGEGRRREGAAREEETVLRLKSLALELDTGRREAGRLQSEAEELAAEGRQCGVELQSLAERMKESAREQEELAAQTSKVEARLEGLRQVHQEELRGFHVLQERCASLAEYLEGKEKELESLRQNFAQFTAVRDSYQRALRDYQTARERQERERQGATDLLARLEGERQALTDRLAVADRRLAEVERALRQAEEEAEAAARQVEPVAASLRAARERCHQLELRVTRVDADLEARYGLWEENTGAAWDGQGDWAVLREREAREKRAQVEQLRAELEALGPIDHGAEEEFGAVCQRLEFLLAQRADIASARDGLQKLMRETRSELGRRFVLLLEETDRSFDRSFREIFGGGEAHLRLEGEATDLEAGVEIVVKMPGKRQQALELLSGGERALTCIAFIFGLLRLKPVPFCLLDEIDAALDEINLVRFSEFLRRLASSIQFIVVTHRQATIECGHSIYGVTMPRDGVSRVYAVTLAEAEELAG